MLDTVPPGLFVYCDEDKEFYLVIGADAELTTVINFSRSFKRYSVIDYTTNYYRWFFQIAAEFFRKLCKDSQDYDTIFL